MTKYAAMALSGGMDSTGLLMHLMSDRNHVHALSSDYGQKQSPEVDMAQANIN